MSLMNAHGFYPIFNIFEVAGAYEVFLDASIAIGDNDRAALHKAYIAAMRIEEANFSWVRCGLTEIKEFAPMNLVDWIMENIVTLVRAEKAA